MQLLLLVIFFMSLLNLTFAVIDSSVILSTRIRVVMLIMLTSILTTRGRIVLMHLGRDMAGKIFQT